MIGCKVVKNSASGVRMTARMLRFAMVTMSATAHESRLPCGLVVQE